VAEALACGLPVAVADPVSISAEVAAAKAGLVHSDMVAGTTDALWQWLALGNSEREQMKQRAVQLFADRFDFASVARNLIPVLQSALPDQSSSANL
jgi:glycosyltransferase involved in cell wall biosynthesis